MAIINPDVAQIMEKAEKNSKLFCINVELLTNLPNSKNRRVETLLK